MVALNNTIDYQFVVIERGDTVWGKCQEVLKEAGVTPTSAAVSRYCKAVLAGNGITDPSKVKVGTYIDMSCLPDGCKDLSQLTVLNQVQTTQRHAKRFGTSVAPSTSTVSDRRTQPLKLDKNQENKTAYNLAYADMEKAAEAGDGVGFRAAYTKMIDSGHAIATEEVEGQYHVLVAAEREKVEIINGLIMIARRGDMQFLQSSIGNLDRFSVRPGDISPEMRTALIIDLSEQASSGSIRTAETLLHLVQTLGLLNNAEVQSFQVTLTDRL